MRDPCRPYLRLPHAAGLLLFTAWLFCVAASAPTEAAKQTKPTKQSKQSKQQRINALRSRLNSLSKKKVAAQRQLRETKRTQVRLSDQLNESYQRLEDLNQELKRAQNRLGKAEADVRAATARLKAAEAELSRQRARFGRRVAASYREGPVSFADVLLGSRNISDFLDRQYYVTRVMERDGGLLRELRAAQERVRHELDLLSQRQADLAAAHEDTAIKMANVADETSSRARLLHEIKSQRALQEQQLQEFEQDSLDIQHALERELARRLANPRGYRSLPQWSGQLYMPARGRITSGFGYRYHPVLKYRRLHAGIDIGAGHGSPVYAAGAGEVFFASWRGGYGRCIIILHGGGVSTLYGHLSRIHVRAGQSVRRGQLIGNVGSTGLSTGPHLHFEVRRNGVPVNPL